MQNKSARRERRDELKLKKKDVVDICNEMESRK